MEYLINHAGSAFFAKTNSKGIKNPHVKIEILKSLKENLGSFINKLQVWMDILNFKEQKEKG